MEKVTFEVIKEYPGSPKLGTQVEVELEEAKEFYKYPEFWKEVETPLFVTLDGYNVFPGDEWYYLKAQTLGIKKTETTEYRGTSKSRVFRFKNWTSARIFQEFLIEVQKYSKINIADMDFNAFDLFRITRSKGDSSLEEIKNYIKDEKVTN
jgi:hypothetical protein